MSMERPTIPHLWWTQWAWLLICSDRSEPRGSKALLSSDVPAGSLGQSGPGLTCDYSWSGCLYSTIFGCWGSSWLDKPSSLVLGDSLPTSGMDLTVYHGVELLVPRAPEKLSSTQFGFLSTFPLSNSIQCNTDLATFVFKNPDRQTSSSASLFLISNLFFYFTDSTCLYKSLRSAKALPAL